MLDIDLTTKEIFCSGSLDAYGLKSQQLVKLIQNPDDFNSIIHPDDRAKMRAFIGLEGLGRFSEEFRVKKPGEITAG